METPPKREARTMKTEQIKKENGQRRKPPNTLGETQMKKKGLLFQNWTRKRPFGNKGGRVQAVPGNWGGPSS